MQGGRRTISSIGLVFGSLLCACRNSTESTTGVLTIVPNVQGTNGCSGPDQVFTAPQVPTALTLSTLVIGPASQVTSAGTGELLYATGDQGQIVAIDVSGAAPVETELVPPGSGAGTVADLLLTVAITTPPVLSGIAVLDADRLVVVEQTSNTLLAVSRLPPVGVEFLAGAPNETPGFADGPAALARFSLGVPCQICPTGDVPPRIVVADAENHALRIVQQDLSGTAFVVTVAGHGLPAYDDGDLDSALFDTPTGLSAACNGTLIVSERGDGTPDFGHRIRRIEIGQPSPFGGYFGTASTIAGDGTDLSTEGVGGLAQVSAPVSPLVTSLGEIYWIDSGSGVLRRMALDGTVDCPLSGDCATASFTAGNEFSLTQTPAGVLFVMDATAGILYRVTP